MSDFAMWMRRHRLFSRSMVISGVVMLWRVSEWGLQFAYVSPRSGVEIAAILAAVQVPATYYAGWAFKIYSENKLP